MIGLDRIAVQEDMMPGPRLEDRFAQAADLGLGGIEFWSETLPKQAAEIGRLNGRRGVVATSVNHGRRSRFLDPDPAERQRALAELEKAMSLAGRIGASGVVFVPHFFGPLLPDLSPLMDAVALEKSLLSAQLEGLAVHAERAGVRLWIEAVNRDETHLLNRLEDAVSLVEPFKQRPLGIVADLFHMALEEEDTEDAIRRQAPFIGHVHIADSNRGLPGEGTSDLRSALETLEEIGYGGWFVLECGEPGNNLPRAEAYLRDLPASLDRLLG